MVVRGEGKGGRGEGRQVQVRWGMPAWGLCLQG